MRVLRIKQREPYRTFTAAIAKASRREAALFLSGLVRALVSSSRSINAQSADRAPSRAEGLRLSRLFGLR